MSDLERYVYEHTRRGECQCGGCIDKGDSPDPVGHTINLGFFKVSAEEGDAETFTRLSKAHHGEHCEVDPFDGTDHSYLELGAWIGDQGLAMQYMGLGVLLGIFKLIDPSALGISRSDPLYMQMLGQGFLSIAFEQTSGL
jgi:hypothetical protein